MHILCTAVAHINSVFVEDLVQAGCLGEMLPDQAEELFADVRFDALAKRWCKPYDLASLLPPFAASCCGAGAIGFSKLQGGRMPACLKGVLVDRFRVIKCLLVA